MIHLVDKQIDWWICPACQRYQPTYGVLHPKCAECGYDTKQAKENGKVV